MSIKGSDLILGPNRGDPSAFIAELIGPDQKDIDYVNGVATWARVAGIDSAIVYDQFSQETFDPSVADCPGTSVRWNRDLNPAGIAIPLDTTNQPYVIPDGDAAARLHVQCLYSLVTRTLHPQIPAPPNWDLWLQAVWLPKVSDAHAPKVATLADLNLRYTDAAGVARATWAWDAAYLDGLLACAAKWLAWVPDAGQPTRGHVPKPPVRQRWVAAAPGLDAEMPMPRAGLIVGTVTHTEQGYFTGTEVSFADPAFGGLTDYQIGGAWDGANNGVIEEFIDPASTVTPYANGVVGEVTPPYGDGLRFVQQFGYGAVVNQRLRSIEHSDGQQPNRTDRAVGDAQWESSCWLLAWIHAEQAGQTSATFDWHLYHCETGTAHQFCPGSWWWQNVDAKIARIKEIMDFFQFGTPMSRALTPTYPAEWPGVRVDQYGPSPAAPAPTPPAGPPPTPKPAPGPSYARALPPPSYAGIDVLDPSQHAWIADPHTVQVKAGMSAPRFQKADPASGKIDRDVPSGQRFRVLWQVHGAPYQKDSTDPANETYFVTAHGSRIPATTLDVVG